MKILIVASDLFREVGGGQTVYRKIIESMPTAEFAYFSQGESASAPRPPNARALPLGVPLKLRVRAAPPFPSYRRLQLREADRYARAVAGQSFDIVDIPDYLSFGSYLRDAFEHHRVKVSRIVLAMHGNISDSIERNWGSAGDNVLEQRMLERDQFAAADGAYAIAKRYVREWQAVVNRPVHCIDPLSFVEIGSGLSSREASAPGKPDLYCIGRTERRKGNDLFVELVRWLDPAQVGHASHIGKELPHALGVGTRQILSDTARKRGISLDFLPSLDRQALNELFRKRSLIILPVRYDTFNLVALEALMQGCPVAISTAAGVCDYLDETFPGIPYIKIDFGNFYEAVSRINDLLRRYDEYRGELERFLAKTLPAIKAPLDMYSLYSRILGAPSAAFDLPRPLVPYREQRETLEGRLARIGKRLLPTETYRKWTDALGTQRRRLVRWLKESEIFGDARFLAALLDARKVPARLRQIAEHSEYSKARLREKLGAIYANVGNPLYRCNFWLEIARIERILGNDLVAVAYELRALRLLGRDAFGALPRVVDALRANRLFLEADAAAALYEDEKMASIRIHAFLVEARQRNLTKVTTPLERLEDWRNGTATVAVIVSLYKAASKLMLFLTMLSEQTLVKQGLVEVIFIDSGSPDDAYGTIQRFQATRPINAVYARSAERETIQGAWNRGILIAKAPYLVFLGVDEALYPDALETLAAELDANPKVDWVMSNSLVTAVDERGVFKNHVMVYDRTGASKDHVYLETCYLSWVGGMYRRSIHDRFGYYDETFSAAGDTEFKNRILAQIDVRYIARTLGLFLNYPEDRTTASPRAEIEDLRAWYIHRTPAGIRYAFDARPVEDAEALLAACLGYRKSYRSHHSSDIEYGAYIAAYISSRSAFGRRLCKELTELLADLRRIEYTHVPRGAMRSLDSLVKLWRNARRIQLDHEQATRDRATPCYKILNDNRYEQHSWLWRTV